MAVLNVGSAMYAHIEEIASVETRGALPEGARLTVYEIEGDIGKQCLWLKPCASATHIYDNTLLYENTLLGWLIVTHEGVEYVFGFKMHEDGLSQPSTEAIKYMQRVLGEVAGRIECYFKTGLPEATEMAEGGVLPRPGEVARRKARGV